MAGTKEGDGYVDAAAVQPMRTQGGHHRARPLRGHVFDDNAPSSQPRHGPRPPRKVRFELREHAEECQRPEAPRDDGLQHSQKRKSAPNAVVVWLLEGLAPLAHSICTRMRSRAEHVDLAEVGPKFDRPVAGYILCYIRLAPTQLIASGGDILVLQNPEIVGVLVPLRVRSERNLVVCATPALNADLVLSAHADSEHIAQRKSRANDPRLRRNELRARQHHQARIHLVVGQARAILIVGDPTPTQLVDPGRGALERERVLEHEIPWHIAVRGAVPHCRPRAAQQ
mmetsp:Transcript_133403/g.386146  ORF Transcript_133403/g.386146 Transcript_133403/m.386146 type:complete len:284 (+) Transcript_133403:1420-2271(+)